MSSITDIFIKRPVLAIVVNLILVAVGWRCISALPIRQYPRIESTKIARKVKATPLAVPESYSLTDVTVGSPAPAGLPSTTYPRLQFRATKRGYDVSVAWAPSAQDTLDIAGAGKPITQHWAAAAAGISLAAIPNPFTSGAEITAHYPSGWFYEIQPGDSVGDGRLRIATFSFRHQWFKTL